MKLLFAGPHPNPPPEGEGAKSRVPFFSPPRQSEGVSA